jgi:MFS family permease
MTTTQRPSTGAIFYALGVLLAINTMNFFDRQILGAVQEKIRVQWGLNDTQLGLLGTAFILLYAVVGLPCGRLADVGRRKWLLAGGLALWSLLTLACGLPTSFWPLFFLRMGVGIGEATCAPVGSSLIGDLVTPKRRARAMSLFMIGLPLGLALSFLVSSTIAERWHWRIAFLVAGWPGLILVIAALFMVDPPRGQADATTADRLPLSVVLVRVLSMPTMWWIIVSGALHNFNMYALSTFLASLLVRYHQVPVTTAGQISGLVYGLGAIGIFAAGWLGDWAYRRGVSGRLHVGWIGMAGATPCFLLALAAPRGDIWSCALWLLPGCMLLYTYYGTVYATIQDINAPSLRGMAMAIYFCAMYIVAAFGPVGTGWLSDWFASWAAQADSAATVSDTHRAMGLHHAMYLVPVLNALVVAVLFAASRTVQGDFSRRHHSGNNGVLK